MAMSRLDDLIKELCPNGVEYKKLEDVCSISKGIQFNKSDMQDDGTYPVINGGINPSGYIEQYNNEENTITISQGGASAGYVNWLETKFWAGAHCYVLKPTKEIMNRFLYHFIKANEKKLQECQYGAGIPALGKSTIASLSIPVPPLPVQEEIVRILDNFTELTAELTARKKQYEYYRDKLLDIENDNGNALVNGYPCEIMTIKEVADNYTGLTYKPSDKAPIGTLVLRSSNIKNNRMAYDDNVFVQMGKIPDRAMAHKNDILVCVRNGSRALIGKAAIVPYTYSPMAFGAFMTVLRAKENIINYKYLFHVWLSSRVQAMVHGDEAMPINQITNKEFSSVTIPVPSLDVQEKIVDILDRFETLAFDLTQGLPAEIEARQKQYEYYRDKLLSFNELEAG